MTAIAQTAAATAPPPQRVERTRFCSRCAATSAEPESQLFPYAFDRVCDRCGMGVMLTAPRRLVQAPGAAFLVVTREGRISAVSEAAEKLVGEEERLVGMPVTAAVTSGDSEARLVRTLVRAAGARDEIAELAVLPAPRSAARARPARPIRARIAACGPPRAALLVLERGPL